MKAIKIDTKEFDIYEVELTEKDQLTELQKHVGGHLEVVHYMNLPDADVLFVDEEGLFKNSNFFYRKMEGGFYVLKGNGLLCGTSPDGETIDVKMSLDDAKEMFNFATDFEVFLMKDRIIN